MYRTLENDFQLFLQEEKKEPLTREEMRDKLIIEDCENLKHCSYRVSDFSQPPNNSRTIMLGDIHGDLEALKYCLRDCAKVINNDDQWIGGNTSVVLVGDMIDRARRKNEGDILTVMDKEGKGVGEVENEEIKILRLLNKLSLEAEVRGGKIIKLLGNHGITHLNQRDSTFGKRYNTNFALSNEKGFSPGDNWSDFVDNEIERPDAQLNEPGRIRLENYVPGATSSELLTGCGGRMIVKIGKWIIVHGGILPDLIENVYEIFKKHNPEFPLLLRTPKFGSLFLKKANELLRKKYKNEDMKNKEIEMYDAYVSNQGLVWDRHLSDNFLFENYSCSNPNQDKSGICNPDSKSGLKTIFSLLGFDDDSKIVVAHSPQYWHGLLDKGVAWSLLRADPVDQTNPVATIFGPVAQTGGVCCNYNSGRLLDDKCPPIPGITYQCPDDNGIGQIWRIDVGMSRGFDLLHEMFPPYWKITKEIESYWEGRKPQVLAVTHFDEKLDEVRVIKSIKSLPRFKNAFDDFMTIKHITDYKVEKIIPKKTYIEAGRSWSDIDPNNALPRCPKCTELRQHLGSGEWAGYCSRCSFNYRARA